MLGPEGVVTAVTCGGRDPAAQVRLVPWGDARGPGSVPEAPPWPGHLPTPEPSLVYAERRPAALRDAAGEPVTVTARCLLSAAPAALEIAGGHWAEVVAWAGPWPAEERWWDKGSARRRARFQVRLADGTAHVVVLESGEWWVEASYD